jgi:hemolysin activation/secretion protein
VTGQVPQTDPLPASAWKTGTCGPFGGPRCCPQSTLSRQNGREPAGAIDLAPHAAVNSQEFQSFLGGTMIFGLCRVAAALAFVGLPVVALAQVIPPSAQPGRERERFVEPTPARAQPRGPVISLPSTVAPAGAEGIMLTIRGVRVVGSSVYSEADLAPLYEGLIGREVSLQAVYDLAQRITAKYGQDGYILSRAIVPPQNLSRGGATIRLQVVEGYIDRVVWPEKIARYRNFFTDYEARIVADRPANIRTLERYLLLLNDLPGLKASTKLEPSKTQLAASTLVVEVTEKPLDLFGRVDNRGSEARGPYQFLGSATVNNILGAHEAFTATWAGTTQLEELEYLYAGYKQVLTSEGLTAFVNGSYSWGRPGTPELQLFNYKTRSTYAESGFYFPVVRSRERNLTVTGLGFLSDNQGVLLDDPGSPPSTFDRLRGYRIKVDADLADPFRGINQVNATFSQGIDGLGSTENGQPLASRANGRVDFAKVEGTYSRLQPLFWNFSAFAAVYGQYAFTPLLSPEQCGYGGRFFGPAFDPSQFVGDNCILALGELRYDMPLATNLISMMQLYAYVDYGNLGNHQPELGTPGNIQAGSVGGGVRFGWPSSITADLSVAHAFEGPGFAALPDDTRFFFIVTARK